VAPVAAVALAVAAGDAAAPAYVLMGCALASAVSCWAVLRSPSSPRG
jgi:hypothetical protein